MDDGLSVGKIVCASIIFSFFLITPLVHSVIYCSTRKKSKALTNPDETNGHIEKHMSEAEIENEFKGDNSFYYLRIYSVHSHIGIVAMIGLYLFINHAMTLVKDILGIYSYVLPFAAFSAIFIEIYYSFELRELGSWVANSTQYLNDLIKTPPKIFMKCEVYHSERRSGFNNDYDIRVTDLVIKREFKFSRWQDTSPSPQSLPLSNKKPYIRVRLSKKIKFGDEDTQSEYNKQWTEFKAEAMIKANRFPGSSAFFHSIDSFDGFKQSFFTFLNPNSLTARPRWLKRRYFLLASLFGLTWFYRLAFKKSTQKTAFRITKTIYSR
jgi:hypothetical protein